MPRQNEATFLRGVLRNNEAAAQFCEMLFRISQTLDDLIDKDNPVADTTLIRTFWEALIELPANPFYREYEPYLRPLMASALQDWRDSACLERSDNRHYKTLAFVLRDQLTAVVTQCAYLVGGYEWMNKVSLSIRDHFHEDVLDDYLAGLDPTQDETYQQDVDASLNGGDQ